MSKTFMLASCGQRGDDKAGCRHTDGYKRDVHNSKRGGLRGAGGAVEGQEQLQLMQW